MLRYGSILVATFLGILPLFVPLLVNNLYFYIPASFVGSFIVLFAFPSCANFFFVRSLTYSDLIDKEVADDKEKWQKIFTRLNTFSSAILICILVFYCVQKYRWAQILHSLDLSHGVSTEVIESMGILSGVVSLFRKWQVIFGKCMIRCIHRFKGRAVVSGSSVSQ